jgi:acetyltransferase
MQQIIEYARAERLQTIEGQVLRENVTMLSMCKEFGFEITPDPDDADLCMVRLSVAN